MPVSVSEWRMRSGSAAGGHALAVRQIGQELRDAGNGLQPLVERLQCPPHGALGEVRRQHDAVLPLDDGEHGGAAHAEEASQQVVGRQRDADLAEHLGLGLERHDLAVHEHPVAVEDNQVHARPSRSDAPWLTERSSIENP
jgi:hypothetical protein